jgi:HNH endonuclease/EVE domain-containing protein
MREWVSHTSNIRYWVFCNNPTFWRLDQFIIDGHRVGDWLATQNKHQIRVGDMVLIRVGIQAQPRLPSGIYAICQVIEGVRDGYGAPSEYLSRPFRDKGDRAATVKLRYLATFLDKPLRTETARLKFPELNKKVFRPTGDQNFEISASEFNKITSLLEADPSEWQDGINKEQEDRLEQKLLADTELSATEKAALILARIGQDKFRSNLLSVEKRCRVTGVDDSRLLRASHIKPWRCCDTNEERLDGENGLLLAPHIDHLFDRGYISFENDGLLLLSDAISREQLELLGLKVGSEINVGLFRPTQARYLAYHRANIFLG